MNKKHSYSKTLLTTNKNFEKIINLTENSKMQVERKGNIIRSNNLSFSNDDYYEFDSVSYISLCPLCEEIINFRKDNSFSCRNFCIEAEEYKECYSNINFFIGKIKEKIVIHLKFDCCRHPKFKIMSDGRILCKNCEYNDYL